MVLNGAIFFVGFFFFSFFESLLFRLVGAGWRSRVVAICSYAPYYHTKNLNLPAKGFFFF